MITYRSYLTYTYNHEKWDSLYSIEIPPYLAYLRNINKRIKVSRDTHVESIHPFNFTNYEDASE